jgi:hypothetical protein
MRRERKQKARETTSWQLHLQFRPALQVEGLFALGAMAAIDAATREYESERG